MLLHFFNLMFLYFLLFLLVLGTWRIWWSWTRARTRSGSLRSTALLNNFISMFVLWSTVLCNMIHSDCTTTYLWTYYESMNLQVYCLVSGNEHSVHTLHHCICTLMPLKLSTAKTVLLWSSYARKQKPLDFPVFLSLTRLMFTISPYLSTISIRFTIYVYTLKHGRNGHHQDSFSILGLLASNQKSVNVLRKYGQNISFCQPII